MTLGKVNYTNFKHIQYLNQPFIWQNKQTNKCYVCHTKEILQ